MKKTLASIIIAAGLSSGALAEDEVSMYTVSNTSDQVTEKILNFGNQGEDYICRYNSSNQVISDLVREVDSYLSGRTSGSTQRNARYKGYLQTGIVQAGAELDSVSRECYETIAEKLGVGSAVQGNSMLFDYIVRANDN